MPVDHSVIIRSECAALRAKAFLLYAALYSEVHTVSLAIVQLISPPNPEVPNGFVPDAPSLKALAGAMIAKAAMINEVAEVISEYHTKKVEAGLL